MIQVILLLFFVAYVIVGGKYVYRSTDRAFVNNWREILYYILCGPTGWIYMLVIGVLAAIVAVSGTYAKARAESKLAAEETAKMVDAWFFKS